MSAIRQWSVFDYPFEIERAHPIVIISNDETCGNEKMLYFNGLICTTVRDNRTPKPWEIFLVQEDGLDQKTAVRCNFIYALPKEKLKNFRGTVTDTRQRQIEKVLGSCFRFRLYTRD